MFFNILLFFFLFSGRQLQSKDCALEYKNPFIKNRSTMAEWPVAPREHGTQIRYTYIYPESIDLKPSYSVITRSISEICHPQYCEHFANNFNHTAGAGFTIDKVIALNQSSPSERIPGSL